MVTKEDVAKIAKLAKLSVEPEELDALTAAMDEIIAFADTINRAGDAQGRFDTLHGLQNALREDEVTPSFPREEILSNREGGENGYFAVRGNSTKRGDAL